MQLTTQLEEINYLSSLCAIVKEPICEAKSIAENEDTYQNEIQDELSMNDEKIEALQELIQRLQERYNHLENNCMACEDHAMTKATKLQALKAVHNTRKQKNTALTLDT
jgi:Mg2+ and Co2+ transporter CorA